MKAQLRKKQHQEAKKLMQAGHTLEALQSFKSNLKENGEHIFLFIDIAACYYTLNDYMMFKEWAYLSMERFKKFAPLISDGNYLRAAIGLGRFYEELGDFIQALEIYKSCLPRNLDNDLKVVGKLYAQILRVQSFLGAKDGFFDQYQACEKKLLEVENLQDSSIKIELSHALILSDFYLGHIDVARNRLEKTMQIVTNPFEKCWVMMDFISEILPIVGLQECQPLLQQLDFTACDEFEKALWILITDQNVNFERLPTMSNVGRFKYLYLLQKLDAGWAQNPLVAQYLHQALSIFTDETKKFLIKRWALLPQERQVQFLRRNNHIVAIADNIEQLFPEDSLFGRCLQLFLNESTAKVSIEKAIQTIYNETLSLTAVEKTRQLVYRLNRELQAHLHIEKAFKINSNFIERRSDVLGSSC